MSPMSTVPAVQKSDGPFEKWLAAGGTPALRGPLRCRLFSGCEIGTAFGAGEHFVGIATQLWIKNTAKHAHGIEVVDGKLFGHEIDFFDADSMFACHAAAQFNASIENIVA